MDRTFVLFDVDGTLVDTAGSGRRALERAFREVYGLAEIAALARSVRFEGKTDPVIVAEMAAAAGLDGADLEAGRSRFEAAYLRALQEILAVPDPRRRVLPGVLALLEELRRRAVPVGLITGNIEPGARAKLAAFDLNRWFPAGGFGSDSPDRREVARIARERVAAHAGTKPDRVVVVGDTVHDVDCARAHGFRVVAVHTGWEDRERLEAASPDVVLDDLSDTARALTALGLSPVRPDHQGRGAR